MVSVPRGFVISLTVACLILHIIDAKTVFRRTDKISDNFKQLNLPPEEIDPNVAPEPEKIETIDPADLSSTTSSPAEDLLEEAGANDLVDQTLNEVDTGSVSAAPATSAPAAAASSSSSSSSSAASTPVNNVNDQSAISKYCKCTDSHCDCCREFGLPLIPVRGPGCAKITYLGDQKMSVSIKYGDITLATRTISGKKARPICVGLPGGYSQFCGRVYGLSKAKENFKACLGFELRADDEVESSLRVSCFKFGPEGLRVAEAEPLPSEVNKDEDDDDDDIFGFGGGGGGDDDDDDYDEDDAEEPEEADNEDDDVDDDDDYPAEAEVEPPADADYGGFSLGGLIDELTDDDDDETKPVKPAAVTPALRTPSAVEATRASTFVQSKDDKETDSSSDSAATGSASSIEEATIQNAATPAPLSTEVTTVKSKKSKKNKKNKNKKNKKKKAVSGSTGSDFAFELLNGLLDFFN